MREQKPFDPQRAALVFYDMTQNRFTEGERRYLKAAVKGLERAHLASLHFMGAGIMSIGDVIAALRHPRPMA